MAYSLPASPNIEQLKNQAKDLLKAQRAGQEEACRRIAEFLPRLHGATPEAVAAARFSLRDAQAVLARGYGFLTWAQLSRHVEQAQEEATDQRVRPLDAADPAVPRAIRAMLDEPSQAAMVLVVLGEQATGQIMQHLSDAEIDTVTRALGALERIAEGQEAQALAVFEAHLAQEPAASRPTPRQAAYGQFVQQALARAVGPDRAGEILGRQGLAVAPSTAPALDAAQREKKRQLLASLQHTPTQQMDLATLRQTLVAMAEIALRQGREVLEEMAGDEMQLEGLLRAGLQLAADGTQRVTLVELLETQMRTQVQAYETRCRMIISGVSSLLAGDNPRIVDHKLASFYQPQP